jgi:hypothetical protein
MTNNSESSYELLNFIFCSLSLEFYEVPNWNLIKQLVTNCDQPKYLKFLFNLHLQIAKDQYKTPSWNFEMIPEGSNIYRKEKRNE